MKPLPALAVLWFLASPSVSADSPSGLVARAQVFSASPRFEALCRLTTVDSTGDRTVRELRVLTARSPGEERFLVQVTSPAFLKNLKFLRVQTAGGTASWLKTSRGTQRLAPEADPEALFGSEFTTADFQPGGLTWAASPGETADTVIVERTTAPRWGWVRQVLTLRKVDLLMVKGEFRDAAGSLVRTYTVKEFTDQGRPKVVRMENPKTGRWSELEVTGFDDAKPIPGAAFNPGNL